MILVGVALFQELGTLCFCLLVPWLLLGIRCSLLVWASGGFDVWWALFVMWVLGLVLWVDLPGFGWRTDSCDIDLWSMVVLIVMLNTEWWFYESVCF